MVKLQYSRQTVKGGEVLEVETVQGESCVRAYTRTSIPHASISPLCPTDAKLIVEWTSSLRAGGYAASSIEGAAKRIDCVLDDTIVVVVTRFPGFRIP